ncbi:hypothetical protein D3C74_413790 [compost metagenome]
MPGQLRGRQGLFVFGIFDHGDHSGAFLQVRRNIHPRIPEVHIEAGMGQIEQISSPQAGIYRGGKPLLQGIPRLGPRMAEQGV